MNLLNLVVSMDFVGPFPKSKSGHEYILTVTEHFARQRIKKDYEARKKAYDKKSIPPNKFSVGQLVRRKIESRIGKFAERYEGPFEVTRVFEDNPNVVEIRKDDGTNDTVNVSKIHHWVLAPPELVCERAKTPEDSVKIVRVPRRIRSMKDTTQQVDEVQATPLSLDIPVGPSPEDPLIQLENFQQNPEPYQLQLDPRQSIMQDPRPKRLRQQSVWLKDGHDGALISSTILRGNQPVDLEETSRLCHPTTTAFTAERRARGSSTTVH